MSILDSQWELIADSEPEKRRRRHADEWAESLANAERKRTGETDVRCYHLHPENWFNEKRCDKLAGHKAKHVYSPKTLFGTDHSTCVYWDHDGSVTYVNRAMQKAFFKSIDDHEGHDPEGPKVAGCAFCAKRITLERPPEP